MYSKLVSSIALYLLFPLKYLFAQSAGAVEYTDCTAAVG